MATRPDLGGEPRMKRCTGPNCGQLVRWARTIGGTDIPLDVDPSMSGNIVPVTLPNGAKRVRILGGNELPALNPCYVPHHRTCPDSPQFRNGKAAGAPKCRAGCGYPMDPWLPEHGWRYHICCAPLPAEQPRSVPAAGEHLPGLDDDTT